MLFRCLSSSFGESHSLLSWYFLGSASFHSSPSPLPPSICRQRLVWRSVLQLPCLQMIFINLHNVPPCSLTWSVPCLVPSLSAVVSLASCTLNVPRLWCKTSIIRSWGLPLQCMWVPLVWVIPAARVSLLSNKALN